MEQPPSAIEPQTNTAYVLVNADVYARARAVLEQSSPALISEPHVAITPMILRSQKAFWRDLPDLLKDTRNHGKWVAYHGDECIGIEKKCDDLIRECLRRGLKDDEYDLDVIEPRALPPWEPEESEAGGHEVDDVEINDQPRTPGTPA